MAFTVDRCVSALVDLGYVFSRREDGSVVVKQPVQRNPRAAEMMNYLAFHKDEVRAVVRAREGVQMQLAADMDVRTSTAQEDQTVINETLGKLCGVDQIRAESGAVATDGSGEVHELVGMNSDEASSLIGFIREGKGELIGQFVYHKSTGLFDASVRFLEGWAD